MISATTDVKLLTDENSAEGGGPISKWQCTIFLCNRNFVSNICAINSNILYSVD